MKNLQKQKKYMREWRKKNPEKARAVDRRREQQPWYKLLRYKKNAKVKGLEWKITDEQFMNFWQQPCEYCGIEIGTIGIDRIDSKKGYLIENLLACCAKCNYMKRDMVAREFIEKCQQIANHLII